mgnify:FL=1
MLVPFNINYINIKNAISTCLMNKLMAFLSYVMVILLQIT